MDLQLGEIITIKDFISDGSALDEQVFVRSGEENNQSFHILHNRNDLRLEIKEDLIGAEFISYTSKQQYKKATQLCLISNIKGYPENINKYIPDIIISKTDRRIIDVRKLQPKARSLLLESEATLSADRAPTYNMLAYNATILNILQGDYIDPKWFCEHSIHLFFEGAPETDIALTMMGMSKQWSVHCPSCKYRLSIGSKGLLRKKLTESKSFTFSCPTCTKGLELVPNPSCSSNIFMLTRATPPPAVTTDISTAA